MRKQIPVDDFRTKYCNNCYWQSQGNCDIAVVRLKHCVNARVDKLTLMLKEEEQMNAEKQNW